MARALPPFLQRFLSRSPPSEDVEYHEQLPRPIATSLLALFILGVSALHLRWTRQHVAPMDMPDVYAYLYNLLGFVDHLKAQGLSGLGASLQELSVGGRPPLYQLLTLPFIALFGRSEDAALAVNLLFIALLLLSVYHLGCMAQGRSAGLLAALIVISYPPVLRLSRSYVPHFAVVAWCALTVCLLLSLREHRTLLRAWGFGLCLASGLLIHPNYLWFVATPTVVFGLYLVFFHAAPRRPPHLARTAAWIRLKLCDRFVAYGLFPAAVVALGCSLPWYFTYGRRLYDQLVFLSSEELIEFREFTSVTHGFPEIAPSVWRFALTAPGVISNVFALFALVGLIFGLFKRQGTTRLLVLTVVAGYTIYSLLRSFPWYNFAAALPFVAVLTAAWIMDLRARWLSRSLALLSMALAIFTFSMVSWGLPIWAKELASALGAPLDSTTCRRPDALAFCPSPPKANSWPIREVIKTVLDDPECQREAHPQKPPCQLLMTKGDGLTDFYFRYVLRAHWPHAKLTIASQRARTYGSSYPLVYLLRSDYIFYRNDVRFQGDPRGNYFYATQKFLQAPPPAFADSHRSMAEYSKSGRTAQLIKRVAPLTVGEAEASIHALDLDDKYKTEQFTLLSQLHAERGDDEQLETLYANVVARLPGGTFPRKLLVETGDFYLAKSDDAKALPAFREAARLAPQNRRIRFRLAVTYQKLGRFEEALHELDAVVRQAPQTIRPRHLQAKIHQSMGNTDQAILVYQKILEIDLHDAAAQAALAKLLEKE